MSLKNWRASFFMFLSIFFLNIQAEQMSEAFGNDTTRTGTIADFIDQLKEKIGEAEKFVEEAQKNFPEGLVEKERDIKELPAEDKREVSEAWKEETSKNFNEDISFLNKIIDQGEVSEEEREDFEKKFDSLKKWFEDILSKVKYFFDVSYNALKQKKISINRVAKAMKKADQFLEKKVGKFELDEKSQKRIKLLILYDINAHLLAELEKGTVGELEIGISDEKIEEIVLKALERGKKILKELGFDLQAIENLILKLGMIKGDLEEQEEMLNKLEEMIKNKFKAKDLQSLELEVLLRKSKKESEAKRKQAEERFKKKLKAVKKIGLESELDIEHKLKKRSERFKEELKQKEKANLELQLLLKEAKEKIKRLQGKIDQMAHGLEEKSKGMMEQEKGKLNNLEKKIKNIEQVIPQ